MLDFELVAFNILSEALSKKGESLRQEKLKNMEEIIQEKKSILSVVYEIDNSAAMRAIYSLAYSDRLRKNEFGPSLETAVKVHKILHEGYEKILPEDMLSSTREAAAEAATQKTLKYYYDKFYKEYCNKFYYEARKLASRIL